MTPLGRIGQSPDTTRAAIDTAGKVGDANEADLFTEISRGVDKFLWMIEAHLQASE